MSEIRKFEGWGLFVDMLAVRYLAEHNPYGLFENFNEFYKQLDLASRSLNVEVISLSDSAFVMSTTLSEIIQLVSSIRPYLFSRGAYFKGGVSFGETRMKDPASGSKIRGISLTGPGIATAYAAQAELNSAGVFVKKPESIFKEAVSAYQDCLGARDIFECVSVGSPRSGKGIFSSYQEIRLAEVERGDKFTFVVGAGKTTDDRLVSDLRGYGAVTKALESYWYAKHLDDKTAMKFVSALVAVAVSSNYETCDYKLEEDSWEGVTPIFWKLYIDELVEKRSKDNPFRDTCFDILYLISFNRILKYQAGKRNLNISEIGDVMIRDIVLSLTLRKVMNIVFARTSVLKSLRFMPAAIIGKDESELILRIYGLWQQNPPALRLPSTKKQGG